MPRAAHTASILRHASFARAPCAAFVLAPMCHATLTRQWRAHTDGVCPRWLWVLCNCRRCWHADLQLQVRHPPMYQVSVQLARVLQQPRPRGQGTTVCSGTVCACVCVRACVCACVCVCVRACMCACVCAWWWRWRWRVHCPMWHLYTTANAEMCMPCTCTCAYIRPQGGRRRRLLRPRGCQPDARVRLRRRL